MIRQSAGIAGFITLGKLLAIWPIGKMKTAKTITVQTALAGWCLSALLWLAASGATVQASTNVHLVWDASSGAGLAGYYIYYGTVEGQYTEKMSVGIQTSATVSNLLEGFTYHFVVTAFNTLGVESEPSNEIVFSVPARLQAPVAQSATNSSPVQVAGSGSLPASQPIRITALTKLVDGSMSLSWDSTPQAGYQVWYKNNFHEAQWTALGQTVTASGSSTSWIDNSAQGKEMRFYRVSLVE